MEETGKLVLVLTPEHPQAEGTLAKLRRSAMQEDEDYGPAGSSSEDVEDEPSSEADGSLEECARRIVPQLESLIGELKRYL